MLQNELNGFSKKKPAKRIGRGNGSGKGTFATKGVKGQTARSGGKRRPGFEGGQTPLIRKMPKIGGFTRPDAKNKRNQVINLKDLELHFNDGDTVTKIDLHQKSLIMSVSRPVKLLSLGKISKKLTITLDFASESAKQAIEKAGGSVNTN